MNFILSSDDGLRQEYIASEKKQRTYTRQQAIEELASNQVLTAKQVELLREVLSNTSLSEDKYELLWQPSDSSEEGYWYNSSESC